MFVAALLLNAPARAAAVVGPDGKPIRGTGRRLVIGEVPDGACKVPPSHRTVAFTLAPETKLVDAVAWIASVTCRPFVVGDTIVAADKRLTMIAPERITPKDAYRLFLGALDQVGLTVERSGKFLRIIEAGTAVTRSAAPEPYVTVLVRWRDLSPEQRGRLLEERKTHGCGNVEASPPETVIITDLQSTIERVLGRPLTVAP